MCMTKSSGHDSRRFRPFLAHHLHKLAFQYQHSNSMNLMIQYQHSNSMNLMIMKSASETFSTTSLTMISFSDLAKWCRPSFGIYECKGTTFCSSHSKSSRRNKTDLPKIRCLEWREPKRRTKIWLHVELPKNDDMDIKLTLSPSPINICQHMSCIPRTCRKARGGTHKYFTR